MIIPVGIQWYQSGTNVARLGGQGQAAVPTRPYDPAFRSKWPLIYPISPQVPAAQHHPAPQTPYADQATLHHEKYELQSE